MTEASEPVTVLLTGKRSPVAVVGAKAAMLDVLHALGAPALSAGSVTTAAYREFVRDPTLAALLERLRTEPLPPPSLHADARHEAEEAFLAAPMPPALEQAILELGESVAPGKTLAVRSSATAEDLAGASFAGQYRSFLDVDITDLPHAVRLCWASLWYPTAREYRRFRQIDERQIAMSALVMPMLHPSHAGVLFTEDPSTAGNLRIEVVEGLGEALVSGATTPTVISVPRDQLESFEPELPQLAELARLSLRLEAELDGPLDIEWAIESGRLYVLQSRPITGVASQGIVRDSVDDVPREQTRYTTAGIAEMVPGVQPPGLWDLNSWLVEESLRSLFDRQGAALDSIDSSQPLLLRIRGRAALDLDAMEAIVRSIPGGSVEELEHQYFGEVFATQKAPPAVASKARGMLHSVRTLRARAQSFEESELIIQAVERVLDAEPEAYSNLDGAALLALRSRLLLLGVRAMASEVSVSATAGASYRSLELFFHAHLEPEDAARTLQDITASDRDELQGYRALAIRDLALELASNPDLAAARDLPSWDSARDALRSSAAGRDYLVRFETALRRAGSTSVFGGETWDEVPSLAWPALRLRSAPSVPAVARAAAFAALERRISGGFRDRLFRAFSGQLMNVRAHFLRREAGDAAAFLQRRELTKASLLRLGGVLARLDREIGSRLHAAGLLESPGDVDLLTGSEVARALHGGGPSLEEISSRRRQLWSHEQSAPLPRLFTGSPPVVVADGPAGDEFTGWPVSPGRYEGPSCLVRSIESAQLRRGDVLVAHTTDSSWLPLFHIAGAIVVEEGGPLSHAAILARELGMPAVVNVPGLVARIEADPGAVVAVDGSTGQVRVHAVEPSPIPSPGDGVVPPRPEPVSATDPGRLNVFITGLIGAGALMSVAIGLTQAVGGRGTQARISRRVAPRAEALAAGVLNGFDAASVGAAGLGTRAQLAALAGMSLLLALLFTWITLGYARSESLPALSATALAASSAVGLVALAAFSARAALRWPLLAPFERRLSTYQASSSFAPSRLFGRAHFYAAVMLLGGVMLLAFLVAEARGALLPTDRRILDWVDAGQPFDQWRPELLDRAFHREYIVPIAAILTLAAYRCRALMFAFPLLVATGGALHLVLAHYIERPRPDIGPKPGFSDSFPGGYLNEQTIMLGMLPLIIYSLLPFMWLRRALRVMALFAIVATMADALRTADHWPSDNLAGLMIGLAMVIIADGISRSPAMHGRCRRCPYQREAEASS